MTERKEAEVVMHLQVMHTWASFALDKDEHFFNRAHFRDIVKWTEDALELIKELSKRGDSNG